MTTPTELIPGIYILPLGVVNAFLINTGRELVLVDTGSPGNAERLVRAVQTLGHRVEEIQHILITHSHPDHIGNLAELKRLTGASVYMHPMAAAVARGETAMWALKPAPGFASRVLFRLFIGPNLRATMPPVSVEHELLDGDELSFVEDLRAVHVPGHCGGHLAYFWPRHGGLLFAGDAAMNMRGLGLSLGYEDLELGMRSLRKLSRLQFHAACFGHGAPILSDASQRFREKWGSQP